MHRRLTAQLALSDKHVVLAYCYRRQIPGPNGETHIAKLFQTTDGGAGWSQLSLVRTWFDRAYRWGFPVWPPESVSSIVAHGREFEILFRDEWVPFEPGGESLWRARRTSSGSWRTHRVRYMRYESDDPPILIPEIAPELPSSVALPTDDALDV